MRREDEIWPHDDDPRKAFFRGAKWWEFYKTGATMWQSDQNITAREAERYYPCGEVTSHIRNNDMLLVYVPTLTAPIRAIIAPGSAIVGHAVPEIPDTLVYFEGNIYNAQGMQKYSEKLLHAAGRLMMRYPTIARASVPYQDLIAVGLYWTTPPRLDIDNYLLLEEWLTCGAS